MNIKFWLRFSYFNLLIVAALGVLLRYKIGFDFPYFDQRNIHHAHSHLAFTGWLTHTIFVLLIHFLNTHVFDLDVRSYRNLLIINLIAAYGMLVTYFYEGYGVASTCFNLLAIIVVVIFTFFAFRDFKKITSQQRAISWFKAALVFNLISAIGTLIIIYMMLIGPFNERTYLASEYFYLHFQYNGFFIFTCLGFAVNEIRKLLPAFSYNKNVFRFFCIALPPAYFLSILWANLPLWLYVIVVLAAFTQLYAWIILLKGIVKAWKNQDTISPIIKVLFLFVGSAFTIKLLLQLGSTIPFISKLAFGFRHIVIAYLHLVLLAVVTGFLLSYLYSNKFLSNTKFTMMALVLIFMGIFFNELVLAIQGIASFSYTAISYANEMLLGVTSILLIGVILLFVSQRNLIE